MDFDAIKSANDIVEVVGSYISLKRDGNSYSALCPFHKERTPSFKVFADSQRYKCFGCNESGDVVNFVAKIERCDVKDAAILLANRAGIKIDEKAGDSRAIYYSVNAEALRVFRETLMYCDKAKDYLKSRQVSAREFELGYADGFTTLLDALPDRVADLCAVGLCRKGKKGHYDTFRNRIMFPVKDIQGRVIAFGGRVIDDSQPKYLNSGESPAFNKSATLYGIHLAKASIPEHGSIVMEGYLDVITAHANGINNAVATLGTALTPYHVGMLQRHSKTMTLVYDGDKAGLSATERSIPILIENDMDANILILPDGLDPHDYLLKHGSDAFRSLLSSAPNAIRFVIAKIKAENDITDPIVKIAVCKRLVALIMKIKDTVKRAVYTNEIASLIGIRSEMLFVSSRIANVEPVALPDGLVVAGIYAAYPELKQRYDIAIPSYTEAEIEAVKAQVPRTERLAQSYLMRQEAKQSYKKAMDAINNIKALIKDGVEEEDQWAVDALMDELIMKCQQVRSR